MKACYVAIFLGITLAFVIAGLIRLQRQFKNLIKENKRLQNALNTANVTLSQKIIAASNNYSQTDNLAATAINKTLTIIKNATTATSLAVSAIEDVPPAPNNHTSAKPLHYYLIKELQVNSATNVVLSTEVFEFTNADLYKSKEAARLFYDQKRSSQFGEEDGTVLKYELYIVNSVFNDVKTEKSAHEVSSDTIKKYLLIDGVGKEQTEGRGFESFALSTYSKSIIRDNGFYLTSANNISSINTFLQGNYKD